MLTDGDETCGGTQSQCSNSSTTPCFVNSDCPSGGTCQVGTVDTAAHNLLSTVVGGKKYTIKTIPIGFGTGEPYQAIEDLAFAGGTPKVPGQNSGFYAQDEAGLELALSQIIESSVRSETCNNMDDDCDGNVDEDFPCSPTCTGPSCNPACQQCDNGKLGVCKGTGTNQCTADGTGVTCNITNPGGSPQTSCPAGKTCNPDNTETCGDGLDNDCDGFVDEGCTACTPTAEICDGRDNDCDGVIDEDVPARQCGAFPGASCSPNAGCCGTQTCAGPSACPGPNCGKYTACNNTVTPGTEQCNGIDDDCDGVVDEDTTKSCSDITGNGCTTPPCPGTNNPGDPANSPIPQNICHPGTQQCTNGTYGACTGEVTPQTEICNGLDDDCDNIIDEDTGGGSCNATCGVGQILCAGSPAAPTCCQPGSCAPGQHQCGTLYCSATSVTTDATCDGVDDDCDGKVDEDWQCGGANGSSPNVPCSCNGNGICNGQNKCVNGAVVCEGTPIDPSSCCDCMGNPQNGSCSGGAMCASNCQCAYPCSGGEFPCPSGKKCDLSGGPPGLCVNDPCFGVTCGTDPANGDAQVCADQNGTGKCVDACSVTTCQNGLRCYGPTGECLPNDCTSPFPDTQCAANQNCVVDPNTGVGTCVSNPCSGVTCPSDQYCEQGNCIQSCASITCPSGQRCRLGMCETDPCGKPCPFGQVCNDATGQCINDPCQFRNCPRGQYCNPNDGMCEADPCVGTMCPSDPPNQVCKGGTCYNATQFQPDGGAETHVTVGGGGCNSSGGGGGLVLVLGVLLLRRRRTQGGAS
jgi:hypothetical protein